MQPVVSVVMPVYNEEKYIGACIESLLRQDYDKSLMEWLFVDGNSEDGTREIVRSYIGRYPELISLLDNPKRIVPCGMNIGIERARGKYIIRLDAHAEYAEDYISKCVLCLDTTDAGNVGGVVETAARTETGRTIAKVLSTKFGVGDSQFRTNGKSGYVDTVPFGAFRREIFETLGGYDERLARGEDNELNYRIRKNGWKIYMSSDIRSKYYCRDTVKSLCSMAYMNGKWNVITMSLVPGSMGLRHFVPFIFLMSLIVLGAGALAYHPIGWLLLAELLLYAAYGTVFSSQKADGFCQLVRMLGICFTFHIAYGFGTLTGCFEMLGKKKRHEG